MQGKQMSMYDFGVVDAPDKKSMHIVVSVESPSGVTWPQDIEVRYNETIAKAIIRYKQMLGKGYYVRYLYTVD